MEKLLLFCKSYDKDMLRARRMAESVYRFNTDHIPLYICVPYKDLDAFKACLEGIPCHLIAEPEVLSETIKVFGDLPDLYPPHLIQQLIKLEFWRLGLCKNYVWIDSDAYFIRPFKASDFMADDETPFTIQHDFHPEDAQKRLGYLPKKIRDKRIGDILSMIKKFKGAFSHRPHIHIYGSPPIIWSCAVLESLYADYLLPHNKTLFELLYQYPCEIQLYGEYIHHSKVIPIHPKAEMFKTFHFADDFMISQMKGEYEYAFSKQYFGICMQSNWTSFEKKKNTVGRLKKHIDEFKIAMGKLKF